MPRRLPGKHLQNSVCARLPVFRGFGSCVFLFLNFVLMSFLRVIGEVAFCIVRRRVPGLFGNRSFLFPFEIPKRKVYDADDDEKKRDQLRRRKKGHDGGAAVIRARKLDEEAPNSVPHAIDGHQGEFVFAVVFIKQDNERRREDK